MATVTVFNAARMLAIEAASVISGLVNGSGHLILTKHDGTTIDAGTVVGPAGATGATGPAGATGATGPAGAQGISGTDASLNVDGLPIMATGTTTWEAYSTTLARFGLSSWTGKRRWVSLSYPGHTAPPDPVAGDLWDDLGGA